MLRYVCLSFAILFVFPAGCEEERYTIEMVPHEDGIERKFTSSGTLGEDRRRELTEQYGEQIDPNTDTFRAVFEHDLPNDVGGAGYYASFVTNLGTAHIYSERFRGNDNIDDAIERLQLLADRFVDFLIGWFEYELGDEPNFVELRAFCDEHLRQDARNMIIYFWLTGVLQNYSEDATEEMAMRVKHYVVERAYLSAEEMPHFAQGLEDGWENTLGLLQLLIADQMGYGAGQPGAEKLAFLSDSRHAEESSANFIRTTEFFARAWEAKKLEEDNPYADPPEPSVHEYVIRDMNVPLNVFSISTHGVEVALTCSSEPFSTNGAWDSNSNQVVWSSSLAGDGELPTFFFAEWSQADEEFQRQHFGTVVLRDKVLSEYCIWRQGLDEAKGEEWERFVESLSPQADLEQEISSFRFFDFQPKKNDADEQAPDLAAKARELILAGLKGENE